MSLDLTLEMGKLAASLGPLASPAGPDQGRVIQFAAARSREGASTVAREFARFIAVRSRRPVWLVDADLIGGSQYGVISSNQMCFGQVGQAAAGTPDGSVFFGLNPPGLDDKGAAIPDALYLVAHPVGGPKLWVTRFRRERMTGEQTVNTTASPAYWNALRRHADLIVVDAPAADRSQTSVMLAPAMDATILVMAADAGQTHEPAILKGALQAAGGRVAGLFLNKVEIEPPAFLKAVMP